MSFVIAAPELVTTAATDLANVGSSLSDANAAAATQTTGVLAAAEDEVSAAIAAVVGGVVEDSAGVASWRRWSR